MNESPGYVILNVEGRQIQLPVVVGTEGEKTALLNGLQQPQIIGALIGPAAAPVVRCFVRESGVGSGSEIQRLDLRRSETAGNQNPGEKSVEKTHDPFSLSD